MMDCRDERCEWVQRREGGENLGLLKDENIL